MTCHVAFTRPFAAAGQEKQTGTNNRADTQRPSRGTQATLKNTQKINNKKGKYIYSRAVYHAPTHCLEVVVSDVETLGST